MTTDTRREKAALASGIVSAVTFGVNELAQYLAQAKIIPYHWIFGYLTDFAGPACLTSLYLANSKENNRVLRYSKALIPAVMGTAFELLQYYAPTPHLTHDVLDFPAYWLGSAFALLEIELFSSKRVVNKIKNLFSKLNPMKYLPAIREKSALHRSISYMPPHSKGTQQFLSTDSSTRPDSFYEHALYKNMPR